MHARLSTLALSLLALPLLAQPACSGRIAAGRSGTLELSPSAATFLIDAVPTGSSAELEVLLTNHGTGPVTVTAAALTVPAEALDWDFETSLPMTIDADATRSLTVVYTRRDDHEIVTELALTVTGMRAKKVTLPIAATLGEGRLVAFPTRLDFGRDPAPLAALRILNTGSRRVTVSEIAVSTADFRATLAATEEAPDLAITSAAPFHGALQIEPGATVPLSVAFLPTEPSPREGELHLVSDAGDVIVPLTGDARVPCLRVRPPVIAIGTKGPDQIVDYPVEIESCNDEPLTLARIALSDLGDALTDLAPPSSAALSLTFDGEAPSLSRPWVLATNEVRTFHVHFEAAAREALGPDGRLDVTGTLLVLTDAQRLAAAIPVTAATAIALSCEHPQPLTVTSDLACTGPRVAGSLDPVVLWRKSEFTTFPACDQVMMTPVVGNLTDDDGDGDIDADDTPDIVFTRFAGANYGGFGVLTAISGDDGHELWTISKGSQRELFGIGGVALGDLEGDGIPEICAQLRMHILACWHAAAPGAADPTPTLAWEALPDDPPPPAPDPILGIYPAIADIDGDGEAEVLFRGRILAGAHGHGVARGDTSHASVLTFAADLDGTLPLEIIDGGRVYSMPQTGTTLVERADIDMDGGYAAVADLDDDGRAEVIVVSWYRHELAVSDIDGFVRWRQPLDDTTTAGGPPTIADLDGDGIPDIGVAGNNAYHAFTRDGAPLWPAIVSKDASSRQTGSSVFDFDGDGAAEILYADEASLRMFDGATAAVRFEVADHASGTGLEYPVIADVNGDRRAEIVLASNNYAFAGWSGITVLGSKFDAWNSTRGVWNQYAYQPAAVSDDLRILAPTASETGPEFRAATWDTGDRPLGDLDIIATSSCPGTCLLGGTFVSADVQFQVANRGLEPMSATIRLQADSASGPVVGEIAVESVPAGSVVIVAKTIPEVLWRNRALVASIFSGPGAAECNAENAVIALGRWPWEHNACAP